MEGAGSGGCWERSRESRTACSPASPALCSSAPGWDRLRSGGRYVLCITAVSKTDLSVATFNKIVQGVRDVVPLGMFK